MRALKAADRARVEGEIARRIGTNSFVFRSVAQVAGGAAIAQMITVAVSPLLTRLYTPADFGVYAAATTVISLVLVLSSLRYSTAIPIPEDDKEAATLIVLAVLGVVLTTAVLGIVLVLFGSGIVTVLGAPALTSILWIVVVAEFGAALYLVVNRWAVRARAYAAVARTSVVQGLGMAAGQIAFAVLGAGSAGLVIGDAIGRSAGTSTLARQMWGSMRSSFAAVSRRSIWQAAVRYRRFPLMSGPGALLNTIHVQAPTIVLLVLFGAITGGQFALAQRVGMLPIRLLGASVAQVYAGELTRQLIVDRSQASALFNRTVRTLALTGIAPVVGLAIGGPLLFPIVFGPDWREAGLYLVLLAPSYFALFVWHPVSSTLDLLERQKIGMWAEALGLALMAGVLAVAITVGAGSTATVLLLGLATAIGTTIALAATFYETRRISRALPYTTSDGGQ